MQWRIVGKDGIIVEVMEVVGVEGSRVLFERYLPLHDTVLKRYRVAMDAPAPPACLPRAMLAPRRASRSHSPEREDRTRRLRSQSPSPAPQLLRAAPGRPRR